jgi:hypothetical protein
MILRGGVSAAAGGYRQQYRGFILAAAGFCRWWWQFAGFSEQGLVPVRADQQIEARILFLDLTGTGSTQKL